MDHYTTQELPARATGIALVTDSTCDLSDAEKLAHVTAQIPLHVELGGMSFLDRLDLDSVEFFRRFRETGQIAQSSQPSVGEFVRLYATLLESYEAVVSIHIAGRLSGTVQSATAAANAVDPARVRTVDSCHVSVGLGLVVQAAGEAIRAGADLEGVLAAARTAVLDTRVFSALPSLDAAVRGGRTSAPVARLGELIQLKPLIIFDPEGAVRTDGARRGYKRALQAVADRVAAFADGTPSRVSIAHADGQADADYLCERLRGLMGDIDIPTVAAGAVITTHVGLGTVAAAVRRQAPPLAQKDS